MAALDIEALATPDGISALTQQVRDYLEKQNVDARATHHVALIIEELVANLGMHGNCSGTPANIKIMVEADLVKVEICDGGPPFDPRLARAPDIQASLSEREIGGLGLHFVRTLSVGLEYSRRGERNFTAFGVAREVDT